MFNGVTKNVSLFFVEELFFQLAQDFSKEEELPVGKCELSLRQNISQDVIIKKYFELPAPVPV